MMLPAGVLLTPLRRIDHAKGDIYHCLKQSDPGFAGFGEAYFSTVLAGVVKGWKQHRSMTMNLVVPVGEVDFFLRGPDDSATTTVRLGESNYQRLTVPAGVWMAFRGASATLNLVLNLASIEHDPEEALAVPLETFPL